MPYVITLVDEIAQLITVKLPLITTNMNIPMNE